jgi:hypothetical protein
VVLLAVIALAGSSYLYHSRARLTLQRMQRVAIELANARLEALHASAFNTVKPPLNAAVTFLSGGPDTWTRTTSDPGEVRSVGGQDFPLTTRVEAVDVDGVPPAADCLRVTVSVIYRRATGERMTLSTIQYPLDPP